VPRSRKEKAATPSSEATSLFILTFGRTISADDYDPSNSEASKNLATLFDNIPKVSTLWESSGSSVSTHWWILLSTARVPIPTKPRHDVYLKQKYEEAKKMLYTDYNTLEKTPFYISLDTAVQDLTQTQFDLIKLKDKIRTTLGPDATKEACDKLYDKLSPPYLAAIEVAQQQFISRSNEVHHYMADIYTYTTQNEEMTLMDMTRSMPH
jgi:hypothetical protein